MKKAIVVGCPGAGKSTFSRRLSATTGLPLHYLDMIWHRPDRTVVGREEFDARLQKILATEEWIIDGNYARTLPDRLACCDTIFFLDIPLELCVEGVKSRIGKERADMPWTEDALDPEFLQWIIDFPHDVLPEINQLLTRCNKTVIRFHSRVEADAYIETISRQTR